MKRNYQESLARLMNLEDLLSLQEAHAATEHQKQEEESRKAAEAAKAQEYVDKRLEIIEQMNLLQKELERMGGRVMEERIAASEELRAREEEKANDLEALKADMDEIQNYIDAVQEIIIRSEQNGISAAPQLSRTLSDAQAMLDEIMRAAPPLIAEISLLQSRQISPEQVREYQWVKAEIANLSILLDEIEQHPSVREYLEETSANAASSDVRKAPIIVQIAYDAPHPAFAALEEQLPMQGETESSVSEPNVPTSHFHVEEEVFSRADPLDQLTNERIRLRQALTDLETEMENAGFFALERKRRLYEDMERHQRDLRLVEDLLKETQEPQEQANTAIF